MTITSPVGGLDMAWALDQQVAAALAPLAAASADQAPLAAGDVLGRRERFDTLLATFFSGLPAVDDVKMTEHEATASDGHRIPMRLYVKDGAAAGPLAVYYHGGGMILGSVAMYEPLLRSLASRSGAAILAPDYRLAPEHPHPTPVEDCYAALAWAAEHAAELGVDPARIGVAGDSAGGGLSAGVALLARDRGGPALARQILIYPMLDDRNTVAPDPAPGPLIWSYEDNITGWGALLGAAAGGGDVSPYAAPARVDDVGGLPPTYIMVGDMDIFRDEDIEYAARLGRAGVPVEFHLVPGAPHGFDFLAPESDIGRRAYDDEVRALRAL